MKAFDINMYPQKDLIPSVLSAVEMYARLFFDETKEVHKISLALEEAIENIRPFAKETNTTINIAVEAEDGEFKVSVTDRATPGDLEKLQGEARLGLEIMQGITDSLQIENLGLEGRRQSFIKYYDKMPEFIDTEEVEEPEPITDAQITIRGPKKDEVPQIITAFYKEYGLTYHHDTIYYPERFFAAIKKDKIHSTVAVDENGNVAGHHAAWQWDNVPGIWESGMANVDSRYRNAGIFKKMMARTYDYVENIAKVKMFMGVCVVTHPYSQKLRLKYDSLPCGFMFNNKPPEVNATAFRKAGEYNNVAFAASIFDKSPQTVYVPEEIQPIIKQIVDGFELPRTYVTDDPDSEPENEMTLQNFEFSPRVRTGWISVNQLGKDCAEALRTAEFELKKNGAEMVALYYPAAAGSAKLYEAAKKEGFFFTAYLPCADVGDVIMMQKMNNHVINYDNMNTIEPFTSLLEQIKALDPDQKINE